jgi:hypothetical protein
MADLNLDWTIDRTPTINNNINFTDEDSAMDIATDIEDDYDDDMPDLELEPTNNYYVNNTNNTIINAYDGSNMINILNNNLLNYIYNNNNNNNNIAQETDDYIPFESERFGIDLVAEEFPVSEEELYCCVCMETSALQTDICKLNCDHKYCNNCMVQHINAHKNNSLCPLCRVKITIVTVKTNETIDLFPFA